MSKVFLRLYERIFFWGVNESDSHIEKDYNILLNKYLSFTAIIFLLHCLSNVIFLGLTKESAFLFLIFLSIIIMGFSSNKIRNNKLIIFIVFTILSLIVTYFSSFCGIESGVYLFYFPLLTALPVFFSLKKDKLYFYMLILLILFGIYISAITNFQLVKKNPYLKGYDHPLLLINITCMICFLSINLFFLEEKSRSYYTTLYNNIYKKTQIKKIESELIQLKELLNKDDITQQSLQVLIDAAQLNDVLFIEKFEKFFPGFLDKIKQKSLMSLTISDLKYCGMLKLGFTTKDIAIYTSSSVKSVESKKYRLRKKLAIPIDEISTDWFSLI